MLIYLYTISSYPRTEPPNKKFTVHDFEKYWQDTRCG